MKKNRCQKTTFQKGFSLVELMIASVILIIAGLAAVNFMRSVSSATVSNKTRSQANQIIDQVHTFLRSSDFQNLEASYPAFPTLELDSKYTVTADIGPISSFNTRQATVTVQWSLGGETITKMSLFTLTDEGAGDGLLPGPGVKGQVIDAKTGLPIPYMPIMFVDRDTGQLDWWSEKTNLKGQFKLTNVIDDANAQISILAMFSKDEVGQDVIPGMGNTTPRPRYYHRISDTEGNHFYEETVDTLTNPSEDLGIIELHPMGSITAQAKESNHGMPIEGYEFLAVPYELVTDKINNGLEFRSREKRLVRVGQSGTAHFFGLVPGKWFIYPVGRPGDILSNYSGPQAYIQRSNLLNDQLAYPGIVRRFDYDFADFPGGTPWVLHFQRKMTAAYSLLQTLDFDDVPLEFPDESLFFEIVSGEEYNDIHHSHSWNRTDNTPGTLVFYVEPGGTVWGEAVESQIRRSNNPYLRTGSVGLPGVEVQADAWVASPETFPGIGIKGQSTVMVKKNGVLHAFYVDAVTYLSRYQYSAFFPASDADPTNFMPPANLNNPSGPFRTMAGVTNGLGQYSIHNLAGSLVAPADYDGVYDRAVIQPIRMTVNDYGNGNVIKGTYLDIRGNNGEDSVLVFNNTGVEVLNQSNMETRMDMILIPTQALASIKGVNLDATQSNMSFSVSYQGYSNDTISTLVAGGFPGNPHAAYSSPKNVIPSASDSDGRTLTFTPGVGGGGVDQEAYIEGTIVARMPDGSNRSLTDIMAEYNASGGGGQISFWGGDDGFIGPSPFQKRIVVPPGNTTSVDLHDVIIRPDQENVINFAGFPNAWTPSVTALYRKNGYAMLSSGGFSTRQNGTAPDGKPRYVHNTIGPDVPLYPVFLPTLTVNVTLDGQPYQPGGLSVYGKYRTWGYASVDPNGVGEINSTNLPDGFLAYEGEADHHIRITATQQVNGPCFDGERTVLFDTMGLMNNTFSPNQVTLVLTSRPCNNPGPGPGGPPGNGNPPPPQPPQPPVQPPVPPPNPGPGGPGNPGNGGGFD